MAGVREPGVDDLEAKVHGLLGTNAMHLGDFAGSVRHTEQALRLCTATGDRAGVTVYTQNLELSRLIDAAEHHDPDALRTIALRQRIATAQDLSDDLAYEASNRLLRPLVDHEPPVRERQATDLRQLGSRGGRRSRDGGRQGSDRNRSERREALHRASPAASR